MREGTRRNEQIVNREGFLQFWAVYPRKVGRLAAIREWNRLAPDAELVAQILTAIEWQRGQWDDPQYIPHPRTWLYQGRWDDEPPASVRQVEWNCPHEPKCLHPRPCTLRQQLAAGKAS